VSELVGPALSTDLIVLHAVPEAVLVVSQDGQVMFGNRAAQQLFGYPDGLGGVAYEDLIPRARPDALRRRLRALEGAEYTTHGSDAAIEARCRDGRAISVGITIARVELDGRPHAVVTARRRVDSEHQHVVERLAAVIESSADAIFTTDLDGIVTSWNGGAQTIYGYAPEEIIGRSVSLLMDEDHAHELVLVLETINRGQPVSDLETVRISKDGQPREVSIAISPLRDERGVIIGASTVARDITERGRAERRIRGLLESAPDAVVVVGPEGRMVLVNRKTEELFGYPREELLSQAVEMLIPERLREEGPHRVGYFTSPETRHTGAALELSGLRSDGTEFPIEMTLSPLHTDEGVLVYASMRDITDRKLIEEELRRSNHDLEQFAYVASHDLSEPLRVIAGFVDLLARRYRGQLDEDADRFIDFTVAGVERMQALIDDLLAYSRAGRANVERREVDAAAVIKDVLWTLEPQLQARGARIEVGELPTVAAEPALLRQIFQNLISNAIKFNDSDEPVVEIRAERTGDGWRFDVVDNGPGVEARFAERVFELFQRLHGRDVQGSGMGLAIVRRLAERHGGRAWVSPAQPRGSVFSFTIPDLGRPS
jgi:PAS domain S-box-containing protein